MININNKLLKALKNTFPNSIIPKKINNLSVGDFKEWDSLGNYNLILEVEEIFNYRFDTRVFSEIKSIKDIKKYLK